MPTSFSRSLRSLEADRFRWSLVGIVVGILLLSSWVAWFFLARVALYEVSDQARLEVGREPHAVMSLVSGRVLRSAMDLDSEVEEGDVLVELDADEVRFQLEEKRAEVAGLAEQLEQAKREIVAQEIKLSSMRDMLPRRLWRSPRRSIRKRSSPLGSPSRKRNEKRISTEKAWCLELKRTPPRPSTARS